MELSRFAMKLFIYIVDFKILDKLGKVIGI